MGISYNRTITRTTKSKTVYFLSDRISYPRTRLRKKQANENFLLISLNLSSLSVQLPRRLVNLICLIPTIFRKPPHYDMIKSSQIGNASGFSRGSFALPNETNISMRTNTVLVKRLFTDTLSNQLLRLDQDSRCHIPVSCARVDCGTYDRAKDVLFLLES
ncbi:unnamed protein product [Adineta ricciae]|uniref:Uncharacterized protein n=1 Tax=Adineta ricciae TaxID=249248 RepID=A0A814TTR8_ADIRI|nr:unnamed protein product [Adineta ricciae]